MKKILLMINLMTVFVVGSFAQNEIEAGFGSSSFLDSSALTATINYSYGIPVYPDVCVGIGFGLRYFFGPHGYAPPGAMEYRFSYSDHYRELAIPAFCFVRYNIELNHISPFIGTKLGVNIPIKVWNEEESALKPGLVYRGGFIEPLAGVSFGRCNERLFSIGISALFQNLRNTIEEKSSLSIAPTLCLGYSF